MIYTDAEYLRAYVREVVEPPGYTTTAKRLLAIADRLEKIDGRKKCEDCGASAEENPT